MTKREPTHPVSGANTVTVPSLDEIASEWDNNVLARAEEMESGTDTSFSDVILPLFCKLMDQYGSGNDVIDVGCGLGYLSQRIFDQRYNVCGIDMSARSIAYASNRFPLIPFYAATIVEFAAEHKNAYDVCIANMVMQNTPDLDDSLKGVFDMLRQAGVLLVSMPHPWFWFQTRQFASQFKFDYLRESLYKIPFRIRNGKPHPSPITYIHRPLSKYFSALRESGFSFIKLIEPRNLAPTPPADLLFLVCGKEGIFGDSTAAQEAVTQVANDA